MAPREEVARNNDADLSVIIVSYRSADDLENCLASLRYVLDSDRPFAEIIVVDNGSGTGRTAALAAKYPEVRFIENSGNHGYAHACNVGARVARGSELLFLNPDILDPGDSVHRIVAIKRSEPGLSILTVRQIDRRGRPQRVFGRFPTVLTILSPIRFLLRLLRPAAFPDPRRTSARRLIVDWVSGSALMISRSDLEQLGGWCEDYWMYSEDVDLCRRARSHGLVVAYSGEVVLEHRHGGSSRLDRDISALARSEVVISKHLYAHRHLNGLHAAIYHAILFLSRFPPLVLATLLARIWPDAPDAVAVRAAMYKHLENHYRRVISDRNWISPRSVNFRSGGEQGSDRPFQRSGAG
ncbi:MAG: glycosyltransferase family 2 protein [Acidobacteria bacterium]|nr:glycosyltransferase family 2 protein [Acidobacteriota bacterium]